MPFIFFANLQDAADLVRDFYRITDFYNWKKIIVRYRINGMKRKKFKSRQASNKILEQDICILIF